MASAISRCVLCHCCWQISTQLGCVFINCNNELCYQFDVYNQFNTWQFCSDCSWMLPKWWLLALVSVTGRASWSLLLWRKATLFSCLSMAELKSNLLLIKSKWIVPPSFFWWLYKWFPAFLWQLSTIMSKPSQYMDNLHLASCNSVFPVFWNGMDWCAEGMQLWYEILMFVVFIISML